MAQRLSEEHVVDQGSRAAPEVPYGVEVEVSIVIPTLDVTSEAVGECLRSLKATLRVPHELIVIDNGAPPQGFTAPVNAGMRAARGRHLVVLNDDVVVLDGWWEPLARALESGEDVVFPTTIDGEMSRFPAWCFAMRRDTLERFAIAPGEFLDLAMSVWYSDTDLLLRLSKAGVPPVCVPESRIRHGNHRTADLEHADDAYRAWLHAQIASDRAAFRAKHPHSPGGPRPHMSPEHLPIALAAGSIALRASGPGWHSLTLAWPEGIGHFFLAGEVALSAWPKEIAVQLVFTDEQDAELFYFDLVPGAMAMLRSGCFCLPRERARAVPESAGGRRDPSWSAIRGIVVRCASEHEASATVTNLRVFAQRLTAAV
jgi:Glycosyl transferase family 2